MGEYSGRVNIPNGTVIAREEGCQFKTMEFARRGLYCGKTAGMTKTEENNCRQCINFYYQHEEQQTLKRSVYASFETF